MRLLFHPRALTESLPSFFVLHVGLRLSVPLKGPVYFVLLPLRSFRLLAGYFDGVVVCILQSAQDCL